MLDTRLSHVCYFQFLITCTLYFSCVWQVEPHYVAHSSPGMSDTTCESTWEESHEKGFRCYSSVFKFKVLLVQLFFWNAYFLLFSSFINSQNWASRLFTFTLHWNWTLNSFITRVALHCIALHSKWFPIEVDLFYHSVTLITGFCFLSQKTFVFADRLVLVMRLLLSFCQHNQEIQIQRIFCSESIFCL